MLDISSHVAWLMRKRPSARASSSGVPALKSTAPVELVTSLEPSLRDLRVAAATWRWLRPDLGGMRGRGARLCYAVPRLMTFLRRTGCRVVALLLAAAVCVDVTLDAACDPIDLSGPASAVAALSADTGSADACASFCVPDCFCCSRSETAGPALTLPPLTALAQVPSPDPASVPAVVRPVAEPPPLAFS